MPKPRKFGSEEEQKIKQLYEEGYSAAVIGRLMHADGQTVLDTLKRIGVPRRRAGSRRLYLPMAELDKMVELYERGWSCEKIAQELGYRWITVNRQLKRAGVTLRPGGFRSGQEHHGWAGGRLIRDDGYVHVLVPADDPFYGMAQKKVGKVRYALEHRLVMARHLGRPLKRNETVHHIDGNRQNNDISNLQLRQGKHGKGAAFVCADCGSRNIKPAALN